MLDTTSKIVARLEDDFSHSITLSLKSLFQNKHLYQSENVIAEFPMDLELLLAPKEAKARADEYFISRTRLNWSTGSTGSQQVGNTTNMRIPFVTPDVKLFCHKCNRVEAFNPRSSDELFAGYSSTDKIYSFSNGITVQVFAFTFLCQSCKSVPEAFLVRREGLKLILCGRAPIEHITVPTEIPKSIKRFFSSAIVAHQSGQTLAGIFLLRTLIEQWAVSQTHDSKSADEALEMYIQSLPIDFKDRFKSFRTIYGELSIDIHNATGSPELFSSTIGSIIEHFEARKLFKI
ncbi:MAG: hypothetical protein NTX44_05065 [Ignavibacteriales bacterium]|nr:hypothetical protein [Ignavibacteriales bacterium]